MPYIGNTVQTQGFTPAIDYFSGNGVTVTFTLSRPVVSVAQMIVSIDNVIQNPSSAYTVSGSSITFTSAPLSGTNNIWVEYTSLITTYAAISQSPSVIGDITASGGYLATGSFGNTFVDGTIIDYTTGNARITTGPADGLTIYNGGTSARNALMALDTSGSVSIGTTTINPLGNGGTQKTLAVSGGSGSGIVSLTSTATADGSIVGVLNFGTTGASTSPTAASINTYLSGSGATNASGYMSFFTRNGSSINEQMRISKEGYITTPYRPAFKQAFDNANTGSAGDYIISTTNGYSFLNTRDAFNTGSYYNQTTGLFTAPVAGTYVFGLSIMRNNVNGGTGDFRLVKNGTSANLWARAYSTYVSSYQQLTFTTITVAAVGDTYGFLLTRANTSIYNDDSYVWGYLLG